MTPSWNIRRQLPSEERGKKNSDEKNDANSECRESLP